MTPGGENWIWRMRPLPHGVVSLYNVVAWSLENKWTLWLCNVAWKLLHHVLTLFFFSTHIIATRCIILLLHHRSVRGEVERNKNTSTTFAGRCVRWCGVGGSVNTLIVAAEERSRLRERVGKWMRHNQAKKNGKREEKGVQTHYKWVYDEKSICVLLFSPERFPSFHNKLSSWAQRSFLGSLN